jgi:hypothetical protein
MVLHLNPYCNFIDVLTSDGQKLLSNSLDKFESPLVGDQRINLCPGGNDFQNLMGNLMQCSQKYGYQFLCTDVASTQTVTPGVPPAINTIAYSNSIKILDIFDDSRLFKLTQKHASIAWGDISFTVQSQKVISMLTQMDGHLTTAGCLTTTGKDLIQGRLHLKVMASQILAMLSDDARQVIEHQSDEYSWTDIDGLDEEMDGMTILSLIL